MKHIKLFEGFFRDMIVHYKPKNFKEFSKKIKEDIDMIMYHILDEYQLTSDGDSDLEFSITRNPMNKISLRYRNIYVDYNDIDDFIKRLQKVDKILKVKYGLSTTLYHTEPRMRLDEVGNINKFIENFEAGIYAGVDRFLFQISLIDEK